MKTTEQNDDRGECALGRRYIFKIINGANTPQRFWSTSCGGEGTFKGNAQDVLQLFDQQIPEQDFRRSPTHCSCRGCLLPRWL